MRPGPVLGEPRSAGREGALEAIAAVRAGGQDVSCLKPLAFGSITDRASDDAWHSDSVPATRVAPWATFRKSVRAQPRGGNRRSTAAHRTSASLRCPPTRLGSAQLADVELVEGQERRLGRGRPRHDPPALAVKSIVVVKVALPFVSF
jgi:hypothetical protein